MKCEKCKNYESKKEKKKYTYCLDRPISLFSFCIFLLLSMIFYSEKKWWFFLMILFSMLMLHYLLTEYNDLEPFKQIRRK